MKRPTTILILTLATIACWGQTKEQKEKEDRIQFVFDSNLPDDLYDFYNQEKIRTTFKINRDLNPFYLRGDFNGDKKTDYALAVNIGSSGWFKESKSASHTVRAIRAF